MGKTRKMTVDAASQQRILDARIETLTRVSNAFRHLAKVMDDEGYAIDAALILNEVAAIEEDRNALATTGAYMPAGKGGIA